MRQKKNVAHFAPINIDPCTGMGRIAVHWRNALINRDWNFYEFGIKQVSMPVLRPLWPNAARSAWKNSKQNTNIILAHEPSAEVLRRTGVPTVLFSHGIESRGANLSPIETDFMSSGIRRLAMRPLWYLREMEIRSAFRRCPLLLLSNEDDRSEIISRFNRNSDDIFVFRNGVNESSLQPGQVTSNVPNILFYGSWLERKGKTLLIKAANLLDAQGYAVNWLLVGTGKSSHEIMSEWPKKLHSSVEIIPSVSADDDDLIYGRASIFVLPSFFEGQPLTLLQAMESGRTVIASRCCGQKDVIRHGHNGFLFEPGDDQELASLIAKALDDTDLRLQIGAQAKQDMKLRRWPAVADEVAIRLENLLN